jgi:hypothetical protein
LEKRTIRKPESLCEKAGKRGLKVEQLIALLNLGDDLGLHGGLVPMLLEQTPWGVEMVFFSMSCRYAVQLVKGDSRRLLRGTGPERL